MLTHQTRYRYDRPVFLGPQTIRLRPSSTARTPVRSYTLRVAPTDCKQTWHQDSYGNHVAEVVFAERVTHFDIIVRLEVDLTPRNPFDFLLEPSIRQWAAPAGFTTALHEDAAQHRAQSIQYQQQAAHDGMFASQTSFELSATQGQFYVQEDHAALALYCATSAAGPHLYAFLTDWVEKAPQNTLDMLVALNRAVARRIGYQVRLESGVWSPEETLTRGIGSCRDSAWLMIALLRHLGFAARFVSGYLIQASQNADGEEVLTCDLHAWAEAFLPGAGWVGFDTTSGLLAAQGHLPLAATPAPEHAAPVTGVLDPCKATFEVSMQTERLHVPDSD